MRAGRGVAQGSFGPRAFDAVPGLMPRLAAALRHAIEIRPIAIERIGAIERLACLRCQVTVVARPEPDNGEPPGQLRCSQPGTSTMAK